MLALSDFKVDRQVFEARFPPSFLLWDRAGAMWTEVSRSFDGLKMVNVVPSSTQFEALYFYLAVEPTVLRITAKDNTPFDKFENQAASFFKIVVDFLEVEIFDRLGFRTIWTRQFQTMLETADAFRSLHPGGEFNGGSFGLEEPSTVFDMKTAWEGSHNGVTLGLRTEKRRVEAQLPWEVRSQLDFATEDRYLLILDVDYHTIPKLQRDRVDVGEWVNSSQRVVKKALAKELFR